MKKKAVRIGALVLVGALVIWCASRWEVWFHNPEEAPYIPSDVPTRVLLTFGDADGKNRNVSWMCGDTLREAYLELVDEETGKMKQVDAAGEVFASRSGVAVYYVARLRNLKAGHYYRYRVWTGGEVSKWYMFFVQGTASNQTSFIYMGDIQDSIGGIANQLLREAFRQNPDAEFLVCGGDLTERPTDAYWQETFEGLDEVGQTVPVLTVPGNHEYLKGLIGTLERRFSLVHSYFLDSTYGDNLVFTVRYKNLQFFCLDSNREFFYLWTQREWLEEQLAASDAKWKIVVVHHPLYSIRGNMNNLMQRWMFDGAIRQYGVDLVLQGHEHAYARMTQHDEEGGAVTPIYTVSHCSPKNYRIEFDERFDKFGSGSRYYQKVCTHGDTLFMTARDANDGTLYDSLYIVKDGTSTLIVDGGKNIPERITFTPDPASKKDVAFAERIKEYKQRKHIK